MDVTLERHCAKFIYVIPDGLKELMSDITREVLRMQPKHLYTFIADYLDALLITRENARIASKLIDSITDIAETTANLLQDTGLTRDQADAVAYVLQHFFKQILEKSKKERPTEVEEGEDEELDFVSKVMEDSGLRDSDVDYDEEKQPRLPSAAEIIQSAFRRFIDRRSHEKDALFGMLDWRVAARSAIHLYRKCGVTEIEANKAAVLIQAAYKGYYTKRIMNKLLKEGLEEKESAILESKKKSDIWPSESASLTKSASETKRTDSETFFSETDVEGPDESVLSIMEEPVQTLEVEPISPDDAEKIIQDERILTESLAIEMPVEMEVIPAVGEEENLVKIDSQATTSLASKTVTSQISLKPEEQTDETKADTIGKIESVIKVDEESKEEETLKRPESKIQEVGDDTTELLEKTESVIRTVDGDKEKGEAIGKTEPVIQVGDEEARSNQISPIDEKTGIENVSIHQEEIEGVDNQITTAAETTDEEQTSIYEISGKTTDNEDYTTTEAVTDEESP